MSTPIAQTGLQLETGEAERSTAMAEDFISGMSPRNHASDGSGSPCWLVGVDCACCPPSSRSQRWSPPLRVAPAAEGSCQYDDPLDGTVGPAHTQLPHQVDQGLDYGSNGSTLPRRSELSTLDPRVGFADEAADGTADAPAAGNPQMVVAPLNLGPDRMWAEAKEDTTVRDQVIAIYKEHNPSKLADVDGLLLEWVGEEHALLSKIRYAHVCSHHQILQARNACVLPHLTGCVNAQPEIQCCMVGGHPA